MNNLPSSILTKTDALPESWIEKMLDEMLLAYGKKFTDQWSGVDSDKLIAYWAREMADFTGPEIRKGLNALSGRDWPPSLPEFKKLCRPPVDPTVAYYEALNGLQEREAGRMGEWSHAAIYWAAIKIGAFDFKNLSYSQIKSRWEQALEKQMQAGEWADIPQPSLALPAPGKSDLSRENAAKMLNEIGAAEVFKPKTDHKLWAKKIIEREKQGDKTLSALQVKFAREALAA